VRRVLRHDVQANAHTFILRQNSVLLLS